MFIDKEITEGRAIGRRDQKKVYDEQGRVSDEKLIERLEGSIRALLYHLEALQHQKRCVLRDYNLVDHDKIPKSLQERFEAVLCLVDIECRSQS